MEALYYYWGPILFYFPIVFFVTVAEHSGCDKIKNKLCNARSIHSNALLRFFFSNFNYHAEHHLFPHIPSIQLEKVHKKLGENFKYQETTYIRFHINFMKSLINKNYKKQ